MFLKTLKNSAVLNAKNLIGWRTKRKIIVFSVDDYGNVRVASKAARKQMDQAGLKIYSRFDAYDTLETRQDLEELYEALSSVKDKNGCHAVFTPFAVPCNIDFEQMEKTGYQEYLYELLPQTFQKLSVFYPKAYEGAWKLLQEGISEGLMVPQFHGREHLNIKVFEEKLSREDQDIFTALKNRSYTSISSNGHKRVSPMAAFDFWNFKENERFKEIILDGLDAFEKVYGYRATHFNAPGSRDHSVLFGTLHDSGIKYLDAPLVKREHQGKGEYKTSINYTGKTSKCGQTFLVRNVVFEPTDERGVDWVSYTMKQIEAAFRWNRPAIISSHRVNFCGHINEKNREKGIRALRELLKKITQRWPNVEFMAANELGNLISGSKK